MSCKAGENIFNYYLHTLYRYLLVSFKRTSLTICILSSKTAFPRLPLAVVHGAQADAVLLDLEAVGIQLAASLQDLEVALMFRQWRTTFSLLWVVVVVEGGNQL